MVVRFNSRNKGGIGTPYFNYLFGSVHTSIRLVNASPARTPITIIVGTNGNPLPMVVATNTMIHNEMNTAPNK